MGNTALTMLCFSKRTQTVIHGTQNANEIKKVLWTHLRKADLHLTETFYQGGAVKEH